MQKIPRGRAKNENPFVGANCNALSSARPKNTVDLVLAFVCGQSQCPGRLHRSDARQVVPNMNDQRRPQRIHEVELMRVEVLEIRTFLARLSRDSAVGFLVRHCLPR